VENTPLIFLVMVAVAVFLLVNSFMVPTFGAERQAAKRLKRRMQQISAAGEKPAAAEMLRERYLRDLNPIERWMETLPGMARLALFVEQSGREVPAYRVVMVCIAAATGGVWVGLLTAGEPLTALLLGAVAAAAPLVKINIERGKRLNRFEEQLPEAVEIMVRALKAGHPFTDTLRLVAEEMDRPIAKEFGMVHTDMNHGLDMKLAFMNLLERVPNMTLMGLVTAVVVQRETGGNLAETLQNISKIIRGRFRFQRRVTTLTAEGRMSAWVLTMIPFVLFIGLMITTPDYLPILIEEPLGRKIVAVSFGLLVIGILWIRKIIRVEV
jgi:tight adherence protein B